MPFADFVNAHSGAKRKAKTSAVLLASMSAALPTAITSGSTPALITKPTGFNGLGFITDDGAVISRSVETADITAMQSTSPIRSDVTSDTESIAVTFHEMNAWVISAYYGVALSTLVPDATTGEVSWAKPELPAQAYSRMLILSRDVGDSGEYLIAELFPRVTISDYDDLSYSKSDDGITYGLTFTSLFDSAAGYSKKTFVAGVGFKADASGLGFPSS
jgi:hypothetical protein